MRLVAAIAWLVPVSLASAHVHMLLVSKPSVKTGESVQIVYKFGHPFEAELSDAEKPEKAVVYAPDGTPTDILKALEPVKWKAGEKSVVGFSCSFEFKERGDYAIVFTSPPVWMEEEKKFYRDVTRVLVHVQTEKGWDRLQVREDAFYFTPLTRPYGLRPGTVFQARLPMGNHRVELERYNESPPRTLPPEERNLP